MNRKEKKLNLTYSPQLHFHDFISYCANINKLDLLPRAEHKVSFTKCLPQSASMLKKNEQNKGFEKPTLLCVSLYNCPPLKDNIHVVVFFFLKLNSLCWDETALWTVFANSAHTKKKETEKRATLIKSSLFVIELFHGGTYRNNIFKQLYTVHCAQLEIAI